MREEVILSQFACDVCDTKAAFRLSVAKEGKHVDVCGKHVRLSWEEITSYWQDDE